jgi:hypothetical protein
MNITGLIVGIALEFLGLFLLSGAFKLEDDFGKVILILIAIGVIFVGAYTLANLEKEDKIEGIKKGVKKKK